MPVFPFDAAHGVIHKDVGRVSRPALPRGVLRGALDLARRRARFLLAVAVVATLPRIDRGDQLKCPLPSTLSSTAADTNDEPDC